MQWCSQLSSFLSFSIRDIRRIAPPPPHPFRGTFFHSTPCSTVLDARKRILTPHRPSKNLLVLSSHPWMFAPRRARSNDDQDDDVVEVEIDVHTDRRVRDRTTSVERD